MDEPILCTLTESGVAERRQIVLEPLKRDLTSVHRIPSGFAYDFSSSPKMSEEVHRAVELERECCRFLTFKIEETDERIRLEVTGPDEAIGIIEEFFGDNG